MGTKKIEKLNDCFYMSPEGKILKYKKYCIINNCKKLSSYNYSGKKEILYCNEHKKDKMVNIRKGYSYCDKHNISYLKFCKECEKFNCLLCNETVNKQHYFDKKHIDNFDKNITIKIKTSIKKKFTDIVIDFHIINKDVFYKDLYFKDKVKKLILKHRKKGKNYKINLYKYNQSVKDDLTNFWIEKFNINNMNEIDNIDKLNFKNFKNLKFLILMKIIYMEEREIFLMVHLLIKKKLIFFLKVTLNMIILKSRLFKTQDWLSN